MTSGSILSVLFWVIFSGQSEGFGRTMQFKFIQGDDTLDGIGCAVSRFESARGIEFETSKETCSALNKTWFLNPSLQAGHNYFELISVKQTIEKTKHLEMPLPDNFRLGDSVVLFVEKEMNISGVVTVRIDLFDGDAIVGRFGSTDHIYAHINNNKYAGLLMFNSFINGNWLAEQTITDPFKNSTGKIEMLILLNTVVIFVNDVYVYNYSTSMTHHLILLSQSLDTFCNEVHLLYKN